MRLVTYEVEHKGGLGVISRDGKWVYPLRSLDMDYKTMQELIEGISESEKQLLEYVSGQDPYKIRGAAPIEEVKFLAPIPNSETGCDLSGYQLHGSRRRVCPLQERGI